MNTRVKHGLMVIVSLLMVSLPTGCNDPCGDLEERVCTAQGPDSAACREVQKRSSTARAADREACANALSFIDELKRAR